MVGVHANLGSGRCGESHTIQIALLPTWRITIGPTTITQALIDSHYQGRIIK
ncbi:hypothetical protein Gorai_018979 [Gossypium raimondii]|uniref:Uncharacterized protein n=1 Tax=Gossypium raimondii TaxID=29730 RepID=A0A7J8PMD0_GOSRA|nr:hypothetical protein [Gossypium raimondii]